MWKSLRVSLLVFGVVFAANAVLAQTALSPTTKIADYQVIPGEAHKGAPPTIQDTGIVVYSALTPGTSFLSTGANSPVDGLPYDEYADDTHLTLGGPLDCFRIGYFEPGNAPVDAVITIYGNDAADTVLNAPVAGPYTVTGLPPGFNIVTITPPDNPIIPVDVWFAISFNPGTSGLVVTVPPSPTVGTSHDVFLDTGLNTPPAGLVNFGGSPAANFMIEIVIEDTTVGVEQNSWSGVKALFR